MPKQTFHNLPEAKRQAIEQVAIVEFAENDYKNASVSRIVARAGIAKGSFYQYFEDKKDLYLYLLQLVTQEKQRFISRTPPRAGQTIFEWLRWMFYVGLDFEFANPQLANIGYRALYGDAPLPAEVREVIRNSSQQFFRQLVGQGMDQGDVDPTLDPDLAAFVLNAIMQQLGEHLLGRMEISPEALMERGARALDRPQYGPIVDSLIAILEHGLGQNPAPSSSITSEENDRQ